VELAPGDALFMHCNTLHFSEPNRSPTPRWSLICCYNAKSNDPYNPLRHPGYYKLDRVENGALLRDKDTAPLTANAAEFASYEAIDTEHGV
jgi:ectoine hydroxylase